MLWTYFLLFDIMQHDHFQKKTILTFCPHQWGQVCITEQNICLYGALYMHNARYFDMQLGYFQKIWPFDPIPGIRCVKGKMFSSMLLYASFPFNLICNMALFWKKWLLSFGIDPNTNFTQVIDPWPSNLKIQLALFKKVFPCLHAKCLLKILTTDLVMNTKILEPPPPS